MTRSTPAPEHAALTATLRGLVLADWGREAVPGWTASALNGKELLVLSQLLDRVASPLP